MVKKLFAGNLSYEMDDKELSDLFNEFGQVLSAKIIINKFNGRSKGYGFIEMENEESAQKAIDGLNDKEVKGRNIKVSFALEKEEGAKIRSNYGGKREVREKRQRR